MRTCRDVLNRLLHDNELNLAQDACVGYLDRFKGAMELSLQKFALGEIPMHRILYFRNGSEVIWHKETRLDLVFSSTDPSRAFTPDAADKRRSDVEQAEQNRLDMEEAARVILQSSRSKRPSIAAAFSDLQRVPVHQCSALSGQWISSHSFSPNRTEDILFNDEQPRQTVLDIATYNVLHDVFLPDALALLNEVRWNAIIQHVRENSVHVWVFTEATAQFADHLLSDEFIRNNYFASDSCASSFHTLTGSKETTGQLVLIRRDVSVKGVFYSKTGPVTGKRLIFVAAALPCGKRASICALHLTSGQQDREETSMSVEKRCQQLAYVLSKMTKFSNCFDMHIIAGDFNSKSSHDENTTAHLLDGYVEAGEALLAPSYDTLRNGLASLQCKEHKSMRLDRIYLRNLSHGSTTAILAHRILGETPIEGIELHESAKDLLPQGIHASDHFGVTTRFLIRTTAESRKNIRKGSWSTSTALALLPDSETETYINSTWRHKFDPEYEKWPAHINVLYPFVGEDFLSQVCSSIRDTLSINGSEIPKHVGMEMGGVQLFKHKSSTTVYLNPEDHVIEKIRDLAMKASIEIVGDLAKISERKQNSCYVPHLTIAKLKNFEEEAINNLMKRTEEQLSSIYRLSQTPKISKLSVLKRINGKMVVVDEIQFPGAEQSSPLKRSLELMKSVARRIFDPESQFQVLPVGSSTLLQFDSCMDLDVVVLPPTIGNVRSASEFTQKMQTVLPKSALVRCVADAQFPIIHMNLLNSDYLPVDIMYGESDSARDAIADSAALLSKLKEKDYSLRILFREALVHLKTWAKSKMLTGKALTMFPGISWSILLFSVCPARSRHSWKHWTSLLVAFFKEYRDYEWNAKSIGIDGATRLDADHSLIERNTGNEVCKVLTPASRRNVTSSVSRAILRAFTNEACKALSVLMMESTVLSWSEYIQQEVELEKEFECFIEVSVYTSPDILQRETVSGWLKGHFVNFALHELEPRGISIRPTDSITWSRAGDERLHSQKGTVLCGIDRVLTTLDFSSWESCIKEAETKLLDKFLRWNGRPVDSCISVTLKAQSIPEEK